MAPDIFLCYRREDTSGHTGRLYDRLEKVYGGRVFIDVLDREYGGNWVQKISAAVAASSVVIVVIGRRWLDLLVEKRSKRTPDYVVHEIAGALTADRQVVPVLVDGATMPLARDLPKRIRLLVRKQALIISDVDFESTCQQLLERLREVLDGSSPRTRGRAMSGDRESALSVVGVEDILAWGWSGLRLASTLMAIDNQTVEGLTPDYAGDPKVFDPILMDHPYTWRLLIDRPASIVGNWHFVGLADREQTMMQAGQLRDRDITAASVRYIDTPGWYDIFFVAVFLLPSARARIENILLLRRSILEHFILLARQRVFISRIWAHAYSPAGTAFCRSFDMQPTIPHADHGHMFMRNLCPLPEGEFFAEFSELDRLYAEALKTRRRD